jgi:hypothetical protein
MLWDILDRLIEKQADTELCTSRACQTMLIGSMAILLKNMGMYPHPSRPSEGMSILGIYTAIEDYVGEEAEGEHTALRGDLCAVQVG